MKRCITGQALSEAIIITPIVIMITLGLIQVLWLLLAAVMFQYAALNAIYSGALTGLSTFNMQSEFQRRIADLPGASVSFGSVSHPASFRLLSPTYEELKPFTTYTDGEAVLQMDHFAVALSQLDAIEKEKLIQLRELVFEAQWCFELRVPLAGKIIAGARRQLSEAQPCLSVTGYPVIPLTQTFVVPLRSDLVVESEGVMEFVTGG